jgi:hypothetical protein
LGIRPFSTARRASSRLVSAAISACSSLTRCRMTPRAASFTAASASATASSAGPTSAATSAHAAIAWARSARAVSARSAAARVGVGVVGPAPVRAARRSPPPPARQSRPRGAARCHRQRGSDRHAPRPLRRPLAALGRSVSARSRPAPAACGPRIYQFLAAIIKRDATKPSHLSPAMGGTSSDAYDCRSCRHDPPRQHRHAKRRTARSTSCRFARGATQRGVSHPIRRASRSPTGRAGTPATARPAGAIVGRADSPGALSGGGASGGVVMPQRNGPPGGGCALAGSSACPLQRPVCGPRSRPSPSTLRISHDAP